MALQRVHLSSYLVNPTKAPGVGAFNRFKPYYQYLPRSPQVVKSTELELSPTAPADLTGYTSSDHKNFDSLVKSQKTQEEPEEPTPAKTSPKVGDITDIDFEELKSLKPKEEQKTGPPPETRSPAKERSESPEGAPPAKRKRSIKTKFDLKD